MAEFKAAAPSNDIEPMTANIRLPGLNITIEHQRSVAISINMLAVPSFEAFGRVLEQANPFAFWIHAAQLAWAPWLDAMRVISLPGTARTELPDAGTNSAPKLTLTKS